MKNCAFFVLQYGIETLPTEARKEKQRKKELEVETDGWWLRVVQQLPPVPVRH